MFGGLAKTEDGSQRTEDGKIETVIARRGFAEAISDDKTGGRKTELEKGFDP